MADSVSMLSSAFNRYASPEPWTRYNTIQHLHATDNRAIIYLAGDGTLDNTHCVRAYECDPAPQYASFCKTQLPDVCHWANIENSRYSCVNCAVQGSTLDDRLANGLLPQDLTIRDNLWTCDILVISIGMNDLTGILRNKLALGSLVPTPTFMLEYNPAYNYLVDFFREGIQNYIKMLTGNCKPRYTILCAPYFPSIYGTGSIDNVLSYLGYNIYPDRLQSVIKKVFSTAYGGFNLLPLYDVLNPNIMEHYVSRVDPSMVGGHLIASAVHKQIELLDRADQLAS